MISNSRYYNLAYQQGNNDYKCSSSKYKNPYKVGTKEHNDYERAWTQHLKRQGL